MYEEQMASLISLIRSKQWRHWKKVVMCDAQLGLSDRSNRVKKYRPFFFFFLFFLFYVLRLSSLNAVLKWRLWCCVFCYKRLLLRRKRTPVRTDVLFKTTNYSKKIWIHAPRHSILDTDGEEETWKSRMGTGHWVTDIYTIATNFESKFLSRPVRSVSSVWHHARCIVGKAKVFPDLKINTSQ